MAKNRIIGMGGALDSARFKYRLAEALGCPASDVDRMVIGKIDRLIEWRGKPEVIRVDNGPEFTSIVFEAWARKHRIKLCFIQSGKPTQNVLIERFNGTYRREVLNAHLFMNLNQVRDQTQQWIWDDNNVRPHESLGNKPPVVFVKQKDNYSLPNLCIDNHLLKETIFAIASD